MDQRFADESEVADFVATLNDSYLLCREVGHTWRPHFARLDDERQGFVRTLRCTRCKTLRHQLLSYSGAVLTSHYEYPDGYQHKGFGRIVGHGRDTMRLESIMRLIRKMEKENDVQGH